MHLTGETLEEISRHAVAEYPAECCGIITGTAEAQRVHRCRNIQDDLHARSPEDHPRTSREAYAIDQAEAGRIIREAAASAEKVMAFYHSHIDCGAYFSRMDRDVQTVLGEPEFPDSIHAVVSVYKKKVHEIKGYLWDQERQDFTETEIM